MKVSVLVVTAGGALAQSSSSISSYRAPVPGAIARSVQDRLAESVSVLDFGADPTGMKDSLPAFNAARAALGPVGTTASPTGTGRIYVPAGRYIFSSGQWLVKGVKVHVICDYGATISYAGAGPVTAPIVMGNDIGAYGDGYFGQSIEGCDLSGGPNVTRAALIASNLADSAVRNVNLRDAPACVEVTYGNTTLLDHVLCTQYAQLMTILPTVGIGLYHMNNVKIVAPAVEDLCSNGFTGINSCVTAFWTSLGATTSTTSNTIGAGLATWTVSACPPGYTAGVRVRTDPSFGVWEEGAIASCSGTALVVNIDTTSGSGTFSSWPFSAGFVTMQTTTAHGLTVGASIALTGISSSFYNAPVAGVGYNVVSTPVLAVLTSKQFTYSVCDNPGRFSEILTTSGALTRISDGALFTPGSGMTPPTGIALISSGPVTIEDGTSEGNGYGITADANSSLVRVLNMDNEANTHGDVISGASLTKISGGIVSDYVHILVPVLGINQPGAIIENVGTDQITIDAGVKGAQILNNSYANTGYAGGGITDNGTDTLIFNNLPANGGIHFPNKMPGFQTSAAIGISAAPPAGGDDPNGYIGALNADAAFVRLGLGGRQFPTCDATHGHGGLWFDKGAVSGGSQLLVCGSDLSNVWVWRTLWDYQMTPTSGTYGDSTHVPTIAVSPDGNVMSISQSPISFPPVAIVGGVVSCAGATSLNSVSLAADGSLTGSCH